jgi:hypothetical protein
MWDTGYGIQDTGYRIQDLKKAVPLIVQLFFLDYVEKI